MQHILLINVQNALDNLLTVRLPVLTSFPAGAAAVPRLTTQIGKISALPAAAKGAPLADELDAEDDRHDGFGSAANLLLHAYLRHPDLSPAMQDVANKLLAVFIPTLSELNATYEAEANAAKNRKAELLALKHDLMLFPVMGGGTLLDWMTSYITSGEKLDTLLSARADAADRKMAAKLRTQTIGMITRLRKELQIDRQNDPSLPGNLDEQVFGYFDMLEAKDDAAAAKKKAAKTPPGAPTAPPAPPGGTNSP